MSVILRVMVFAPVFSLLMACSANQFSNGAKRINGGAEFGKYKVVWASLSALQDRAPEGLTPLIFSFSSNDPAANNGVTQEDLQKAADELGMPVGDIDIVYGKTPYKTADGRLAACTFGAISKGLCGKKLRLSVEQRADMAEKALAQSNECAWVKFDPAYNAANSFQLGAVDFTLHVLASCP